MISLIIILSTVAVLHDPFASGGNNPDPQTDYSQSLPLHPGWNLVSWHIWPSGVPEVYLTIEDMLPDDGPQGEHSWFHYDPGGKVYVHTDENHWWPEHEEIGSQDWIVHRAYYFDMNGSEYWNEYEDLPEVWTYSSDIEVTPSTAWAHDQNVGSIYASNWFFMGYAAPGYSKLASIPNAEQDIVGDPDLFDFEGPFHWLMWYDSRIPGNPEGFPRYDLRIVKDDLGKVYLPIPNPTGAWRPHIDQIGVLEPGRGYFLGFIGEGPYTFEGWADWPQWRDESSMGPAPKTGEPEIASAAHFQYNPYTHWSYPIVIDTVDQAQCPMEAGDELGVFDGDRCVGAVIYQGEFPAVLAAWEDDIATPMELDGYLFGSPMTFKWYDASENAEVEFQLPPETQALQDDPVAPDHSGFGWVVRAAQLHGAVHRRGEPTAAGIQVRTKLPQSLQRRDRHSAGVTPEIEGETGDLQRPGPALREAL